MKDSKGPSAAKWHSNQSAATQEPSKHVRRFTRSSLAQHLPPGPLPIELWMKIIGEYSSPKECLALCKTSRFFHPIAQTCLYKKPVLESFQEHGKPPCSLRQFSNSFQGRPELGTLVHELSLDVDTRLKGIRAGKSYSPHDFLSKLERLPNLRKLRVVRHQVDANLCQAIHSHPRLRVLELVACTLDDSFLRSTTMDYSKSSLSDLKIVKHGQNAPVEEGAWGTFASAGLRSLQILSYRSFGEKPALILSDIMTSGKNSMLEELSIGFFSCSLQFLISSHRLRRLVIDISYIEDNLYFSSLPPDAIPLLEHYDGPAEFSQALLRNRPVHSVGLSCRTRGGTSIMHHSIHLPSVPVTRLKLDYKPQWDWLQHIPVTIRHLTFPLYKEFFEECSRPALSRLTDLRTICGTPTFPRIYALSRKKVTQLSATCPSLQEFDVCGYEKWLMVKPDVWERFTFQREY